MLSGGALVHGADAGALVDRLRRDRRAARRRGSRSPAPGRGPGSAGRSPASTRSRTATRPSSSRRPGAPTTPTVAGAAEVVLEPFPAGAPNTDLDGDGRRRSASGGDGDPARRRRARRDRHGGAQAAGRGAAGRDGHGPADPPVEPGHGRRDALGGGPLLVRDGKPVFHTSENFDDRPTLASARSARAAVGQLADGRIDPRRGRRRAARLQRRDDDLRARADDGRARRRDRGRRSQYGKPVTAAFDGQLLSRPTGRRRPVAVKEALLLQYAGVYAPPAVRRRRSARTTRRPASSSRTGSCGRRRSPRPSSARTARRTRSTRATGSPARTASPGRALDAEGTWHWNVQATDDLDRQSSADQSFVYDLTLSALAVPNRVDGGGLKVALHALAAGVRDAPDRAPNGTVVVTLPRRELAAGRAVAHLGRHALDAGAKAPPGSYVATVTATSSVGTIGLSRALQTAHG